MIHLCIVQVSKSAFQEMKPLRLEKVEDCSWDYNLKLAVPLIPGTAFLFLAEGITFPFAWANKKGLSKRTGLKSISSRMILTYLVAY